MFGSLRLLLASLVGLSHLGVSVGGFNPGVFAVVMFFLISGFVTCAIIDRLQQQAIVNFYAERLVRLMPSYWGALALAAAVWALWHPQGWSLQLVPTAGDWLANITVVPLNFFMWTQQDKFSLIPPAWSLGLELQFYIFAPFVFRAGQRVGFLLMAASGSLFLAADFGAIHTDTWGYRLLPGVLFIFIVGGALNRRQRWTALAVWGAGLVLLAVLLTRRPLVQPFNVETATGLVIGIPAIAGLARLARQRWDDFCANLAYPFFLLHFPAAWIIERVGPPIGAIAAKPLWLAAWFGLTLALSWLLYLGTEAPLAAWRRKWRQRAQTKLEAAEAAAG